MPSSALKIFHFDFNFICLKKDTLLHWIKKVADMGYNAILWELENKVAWKTCPECVWPEGLSQDEFKEVLSFSRELGLEPIPLLQTIGHGEYVLLHKKYHTLREETKSHDCYCTSNEEVKTFFKTWIKEYLDLFGDLKYFHLGGDEAYVFGVCPVCKKAIEESSPNALYSAYLEEISVPLKEKGVRACIWADMILHYPGDIESISKEFLIWDWNYWSTEKSPDQANVMGKWLKANEITDDVKGIFKEILNDDGKIRSFYTSDFLKRKGYDVILCSASRSAGDTVYCGRPDAHNGNVIAVSQKARELDLSGFCLTSWAVRMSNYEVQEAWIQLGVQAFNEDKKDREILLAECSEKLFGVKSLEFFKAIEKVGCTVASAVTSKSGGTGIQWNGLKDSLPAPEGLFEERINKWKEDTNWQEIKDANVNAINKIDEGLKALEAFSEKIKTGQAIIEHWQIAGELSWRHANLMAHVFNEADGDEEVSRRDLHLEVVLLRKDFQAWAGTSMAPKSADKNAGLIYNALMEYFKE